MTTLQCVYRSGCLYATRCESAGYCTSEMAAVVPTPQSSKNDLSSIVERLRRQMDWWTHGNGPAPFMWDDLCATALTIFERQQVETTCSECQCALDPECTFARCPRLAVKSPAEGQS